MVNLLCVFTNNMLQCCIMKFIVLILLIAGSIPASDFISYNGKYTNIVFTSNKPIWRDRSSFTYEKIVDECKKQPKNPDVWYIGGYFLQFFASDREKAADYYKKSMELATNALKPAVAYLEIKSSLKISDELFAILTNTFYLIKNTDNTLQWASAVHDFTFHSSIKGKNNFIKKLIRFIKTKKDEIPNGDYALFMVYNAAGKYKEELLIAKKMVAKGIKNRIIKNNVGNFIHSLYYKIKDNPELLSQRDEILRKVYSPYKYAYEKLGTLYNNYPELLKQTSNLFSSCNSQSRRIDSLHELVSYCNRIYTNEIKYFLDKIAAEKVTAFSRVGTLAYYYKQISDYDSLFNYLTNAIPQMPADTDRFAQPILYYQYLFYGPKNLKTNDIYILELISEHFKTNYLPISLVADIYKKYNLNKDELRYREKALKFAPNSDERIKTEMRIAELKMKLGEKYDEKTIARAEEKAKNNFAAAKTLAVYYLSIGKTNSAFNALKKCYENAPLPREKRAVVETIINTDFGSVNKDAFDFAYNLITNDFKKYERLSSKLIASYDNAGMTDKALDLLICSVKNSGFFRSCDSVIKKSPDKFVEKIITAGVTNEKFLAWAAYILKYKNKDENTEMTLRKYYINLPNKFPDKYYNAAEILGYAFRTGDTNLCLAMVEKIDEFVKQKIVPKRLPDNLYYYMRKLNLNEKCNQWIDFLKNNINEKYYTKNLSDFIQWYRQTGETNKLLALIQQAAEKKLPVRNVFNLASTALSIGKTNLYIKYISLAGNTLTNSSEVNLYGSKYVNNLSYIADNYDKSYYDKLVSFVDKWFFNKEIKIRVKVEFLAYVKTNRSRYLAEILKHKDKLSYYELTRFSKYFIQEGQTNKGLEVLEFIVEKPDVRNYDKVKSLVKAAFICKSNEEFERAQSYLDKIGQIKFMKKNVFEQLELGTLLVRAFAYDKAVKTFLDAINNAEKIDQVERAVLSIRGAWEFDSSVDYNELARTDFTNKNAAINFAARAFLNLFAGNYSAAEKYISMADKILKTKNEKYNLWKNWSYIASYTDDTDSQLMGNMKMLELTDDVKQKINTVKYTTRLLTQMNDNQAIIKLNLETLNTVTNQKKRDDILMSIGWAYARLGDTNTAWDFFRQISSARNLQRCASQLGLQNDLIYEFENRLESANSNNFPEICRTLARAYYPKNIAALKRLAFLIQIRSDEISPKNYIDISLILLYAGDKAAARNLLERYIDLLDEKDKPKARKMLDKYLDLNWRMQQRYRGYIPPEDNFRRFWRR